MALTIFESIGLDNLLGLIDDIRHIDLRRSWVRYEKRFSFLPTHADDVLCTRFGGEHAQYTRAASNIEYGFAFEKMSIVDDGGAVRACPYSILQHLLMDACESIINIKKLLRSFAVH